MPSPPNASIRRSRVRLEGEAVIRGAEGDWRGPVCNVSVTGLRMLRPPGFGLRVGQAVEVELHCGSPDAAIELLMLARVARSDARTLGLRFAPMPDRLERALERALARQGTTRAPVADGWRDDRRVHP